VAKVVGIYSIRNTVNSKVYIGQSVDVASRFIRHRYHLKKNVHPNIHLQRSYNKYGADCFEFNIIEECDAGTLCEKEQCWIDYNKDLAYNINTNIEDLSGSNNPFFGKKHSEKTKLKMSSNRIGKYKEEENPNYGNKNNKETRKNMATNRMKKLTIENVREIRELLTQKISHSRIAAKFNVNRSIVTRINSGTRYALIS